MVRFKNRYLVATVTGTSEQMASLDAKGIFAMLKVRDLLYNTVFNTPVDGFCTQSINVHFDLHLFCPRFFFPINHVMPGVPFREFALEKYFDTRRRGLPAVQRLLFRSRKIEIRNNRLQPNGEILGGLNSSSLEVDIERGRSTAYPNRLLSVPLWCQRIPEDSFPGDVVKGNGDTYHTSPLLRQSWYWGCYLPNVVACFGERLRQTLLLQHWRADNAVTQSTLLLRPSDFGARLTLFMQLMTPR